MSNFINHNAARGFAFLGSLGLLAGMAQGQAPIERPQPAVPSYQNLPPVNQDYPDLSVTPSPVAPGNPAGSRAHEVVMAIVDYHDSIKAALALPEASPTRDQFITSLSTIAGRDKVEPLIEQAAVVLGLVKTAFTKGGAAETEDEMISLRVEAAKLGKLEVIVKKAGGLPAIKMEPRIDGIPAKLINVFLQLNDQGFVKLNEDEWKSLQKNMPIPQRNELAQEAKDSLQTIFNNRLNTLGGSARMDDNLRKRFADEERPLVLQQINGALLQLGAAYRLAASGYNHPDEGARSTFNYVLDQLPLIEEQEKEIRDRVLTPGMPRASLEAPADGLRSQFDRYNLPLKNGMAYGG